MTRMLRFGFVVAACITLSSAADAPAESKPAAPVAAPDGGSYGQKGQNATVAVVKVLADGLNTQLHNPHFQWVNALAALILGKVMLVSGEFAFKYCMISCFGLMSYLLAKVFIVSGHPHMYPVVQMAGATEVAILAIFIAYVGWMGVRLAMGICLGAFIGSWVRSEAQAHAPAMADNWAFLIFGMNFCLLLGLYPFVDVGKGHHRLMAYILSFAGGAFIVSAWAFLFTDLAQVMPTAFAVGGIKVPADVPNYWIDFIYALIFTSAPKVGMFAGTDWTINTTAIFGTVWGLDRILMRFFWMLFTIAGAVFQVKSHNKKAAKAKAEAAVEKASKKGGLKAQKSDNTVAPKKAGFMARFKRGGSDNDVAGDKSQPLLE